METILIYKVTCTQAPTTEETGTRFALEPWPGNTMAYEGFDDGGTKYVVPAGFEVTVMVQGANACYGYNSETYKDNVEVIGGGKITYLIEDENDCCPIVLVNKNDAPALLFMYEHIIPLKKSE